MSATGDGCVAQLAGLNGDRLFTHNEHEDVDPERVLRAAGVLARVVLETAQR